MYDAIVIGARCAGAPLAMLLARRGGRILLLDRATFPSEIRHGHYIHRHGPRRLAAWGVLDRLVSPDCPPIASVTLDLGDFPLTGRDLVVDGIAVGYAPRRSVLDHVLVRAAVEAGVELREGCTLEALLDDPSGVSGVRARGPHGSSFTERARLVIGADGRHSRVAALARAPMSEVHPAAASWYFSYWSGVACDGVELYVRGDRALFVHPTSDRLTAIFVAAPAPMRPRTRDAIEPHVMDAIDRVPALADRVREGRREERFYGAVDLPNFRRKPFGPGWALVGDAGCHKDPYLALGVCDAFRDADTLADAIDRGFSGRVPMADALADYESGRDDATRDDFAQNLHAARFAPPPPDVLRARAEARGDQAATNRLFLKREGLIV